MLNIVVRTIGRQLVIRAPDPASADVLAYMKADPQIDGPAPARIDIDIEPVHGFLRFALAAPSVEGSALHILSALHRLHFCCVPALCAAAFETPGANGAGPAEFGSRSLS